MLRSNYCIANRFIIETQIGEGSFGEVYNAKDLNTDRHVAIKVESRDARIPMLKYEA